MNIGDRVTFKKTGQPGTGTIMGIYHSGMLENKGTQFKKWYELYPDWETKYVYAVKFDRPQKYASLEEFKEMWKDYIEEHQIDEQRIRMEYENRIKTVLTAMYPEEDLETLE